MRIRPERGRDSLGVGRLAGAAASTILQDATPYTLLFSKGFGVPHIIPASFPTGRIRPVFRPLILCSARILRSCRTSSDWVNPFRINDGPGLSQVADATLVNLALIQLLRQVAEAPESKTGLPLFDDWSP